MMTLNPLREPPTARQLEVLRFVAGYIEDRGYAPTCRDICQHFGWVSTVAAIGHLRSLQRKGAIDRTPGIARGLRITEQGRAMCSA